METVAFVNSLGQRISGRLHRGDAGDGALGPTVVLCHGMMSSKEGRKQIVFARALETAGFSVLRFDFSFCGESGGKFEEITFSQEVDDLAAAVLWVKERGAAPLGLLGSSMGGAVAILYGGRDASVKAMVTMAAVARPQRLAASHAFLRKKIGEWQEAGYRLGAEGEVGPKFFEDVGKHDVPGAMERLALAVLILHGAADEIVPVEEAYELFEKARGPRELRVFPDADHRFTGDEVLQEAVLLTVGWFNRFLRS